MAKCIVFSSEHCPRRRTLDAAANYLERKRIEKAVKNGTASAQELEDWKFDDRVPEVNADILTASRNVTKEINGLVNFGSSVLEEQAEALRESW